MISSGYFGSRRCVASRDFSTGLCSGPHGSRLALSGQAIIPTRHASSFDVVAVHSQASIAGATLRTGISVLRPVVGSSSLLKLCLLGYVTEMSLKG